MEIILAVFIWVITHLSNEGGIVQMGAIWRCKTFDKRPYVVLSDSKTLKYQASSPQLPSTSIGMSDAPNKDDSGKAFSDEDEEIDFALEGSDS